MQIVQAEHYVVSTKNFRGARLCSARTFPTNDYRVQLNENVFHVAQEQSHKSYRPLSVLTFRLNYAIHELDPLGYHLVNVLLHVLVCILYHR